MAESPFSKQDILAGVAELKRLLAKKPISRRAIRLLAAWDQVKEEMRRRPDTFAAAFVKLYDMTPVAAAEAVCALLNEEV